MKKKYQVLAFKVVIIVMGLFIISAAVLTYEKALQVKDEYKRVCYGKSGFITDIRYEIWEGASKDTVVKSAYKSLGNAYIYQDDIGFYSELKDKKGTPLAFSQNYMIVRKDNGDMRIVLMEDALSIDVEDVDATTEFANNTIENIQFDGLCDGTYIYPTKMVWKSYDSEMHEYKFNDIDKQDVSDTISFKEWVGKDNYYLTTHYVGTVYGDAIKKDKINEEAKGAYDKIYNDYINGDTKEDQTSEGIFTTYVAGTGYLDKNAVMPYVYVFHPIAIAMSELSGFYIALSCITIGMIVIICMLVKKMYTQQSEFDNRTRNMTRGIAHELKTPLAITKSYVENWQYIDEEDRSYYYENMVDEIEHMNMLVNDILELSRMEAGVKELQKEEVDILELTNTIYAHMKGMIEEKNLEIDIVTDGMKKEYLVNADLEMMRIVITNFISNAVKYADKKITVHLTGVGKKIAFYIENDGAVIQKEDIDRVWDTFYKTDNTRTNRIGSSGLGLAITKNILLLHNAKFGCRSDNGKTIFWFELKMMEEERIDA